MHVQSVSDCVSAWRSHGTLARQAGKRFGDIVGGIEALLHNTGERTLSIPYTTVLTMAQRA